VEGGRSSASSSRPGGDAAPHLAPSRDAARSGTDTRRGSICCGKGGFQSLGISLIASTRGRRGSHFWYHHETRLDPAAGITWHRHETRLDLAPTQDAARSAAEGAAFRVSDSASSPRPDSDEARTSGTITRRCSIRRRASPGTITRRGSIWRRRETRLDLLRKGQPSESRTQPHRLNQTETRLALLVPTITRRGSIQWRASPGTVTRRGSIWRRHETRHDLLRKGRPSESRTQPHCLDQRETRLALLVPSRDAARSGGGHHLRHGKIGYASTHLNTMRRPGK